MCAPNELRMESPSVSRFNSRSSDNNTLVGSCSGSLSLKDRTPSQISILYTASDNEQWFHLDNVSPKLLQVLRRQCDPAYKDDRISKGAAKIKAWARQSKLGIDIRLRRKISTEHDEITDITLTPEHAKPLLALDQPAVPELPAEHEISEMPDTSVALELPATPDQRPRGSIEEPLPRYERYPQNAPTPVHPPAGPSMTGNQASAEEPPSPTLSLLPTPTRGLSLNNVPSEPPFDTVLPAQQEDRGTSDATEQISSSGKKSDIAALQENLTETRRKLEEQQQISESFQAILKALGHQTAPEENSTPEEESTLDARRILRGLKVTQSAVYETETDVEPTSRSTSVKSRANIQGRRPANQSKARRNHKDKVSVIRAKDGEVEPEANASGSSLLRRHTIPKKTPASAGLEEVWSNLLQTQATILGFEHPLVYQAKTDLARSRASHHKGETFLDTLYESQNVAEALLGAHPLVAKLSADLETLKGLTGYTAKEDKAQEEPDDAKLWVTAPPESVSDPGVPLAEAPSSERPSAVSQEDRPETARTAPPDHTGSDDMHIDARTQVPVITTTFSDDYTDPATASVEPHIPQHVLYNNYHLPHKPKGRVSVFCGLVFDSMARNAVQGITWLRKHYGPEPDVEPDKVRVRWTCSCGEQLYDDFIERRHGAARELEAYLNRPRARARPDSPVSPSSSMGSRSFTNNSSLGGPPSSQTSWSSHAFSVGQGANGTKKDNPPLLSADSLPLFTPYHAPEPPWLLTCANEDRYTPKLSHLDMSPARIRSDKDLALALRDHYYHVNKRWYRSFRLRGLCSIEFVQFEVHQNRFCDLRKVPDMPPASLYSEYSFEPGDLLPPVGSTYLLHLFKHPQDYDGELITYVRSPKKNGRISLGVGWGINLVEGFEVTKVWALVSALFALTSAVFGVVWAWIKQDVQGAFGVSAWVLVLSTVVIGWMEASLG